MVGAYTRYALGMGWYCPRCGHEAEVAGSCPRDFEPLSRVSSHDLLGRRLGEYTVLASLGGGSFGTVYRAVHARSGMLVAIKLLHQPIDHAESHRVLTEARAAAMMQHPNMVQVYDLGLTLDRRPYIVMQLLDGTSLARVMREPLPVALALSLAKDILTGLGVAHSRGVIHRDLKPDNIYVCAGRGVIVDFGLAKLIADPRAPSLTMTGDAIGTPTYMAPEQIQSAMTDGRADLYAVACVLFEMLSGRPPFQGSTFVLFEAHCKHPPPSIATLRPDVPPHVDAAITRALAKDPTARFADAAAMQRALAGISESGPDPGVDTPGPGRRSRWPIPVAIGGTAFGALATFAIVAGSTDAALTNDGGSSVEPTKRVTIVVPPLEPGEKSDSRLDTALVQIAENIPSYSRDQVVRMRCDLEKVRGIATIDTMHSYNRRFMRMLDDALPGIDLAKDCAIKYRVPLPPPLTHEPRLDPSMKSALADTHEQLELGRLGRPLAVTLLCAHYKMREAMRGREPPVQKAFNRRYELLLRGYYPDLDAAECKP